MKVHYITLLATNIIRIFKVTTYTTVISILLFLARFAYLHNIQKLCGKDCYLLPLISALFLPEVYPILAEHIVV